MILTIPVNALIASYSKKLQAKQMVFKDSRIKIVNEVLNGIKVISVFTIETAYICTLDVRNCTNDSVFTCTCRIRVFSFLEIHI